MKRARVSTARPDLPGLRCKNFPFAGHDEGAQNLAALRRRQPRSERSSLRAAQGRRVVSSNYGARVGLPIFGERLPPLRLVRRDSYRVVIVLAMLRTRGNISAAARALDMTRKVLRENLERARLLPWRSARPTDDAGRHA